MFRRSQSGYPFLRHLKKISFSSQHKDGQKDGPVFSSVAIMKDGNVVKVAEGLLVFVHFLSMMVLPKSSAAPPARGGNVRQRPSYMDWIPDMWSQILSRSFPHPHIHNTNSSCLSFFSGFYRRFPHGRSVVRPRRHDTGLSAHIQDSSGSGWVCCLATFFCSSF